MIGIKEDTEEDKQAQEDQERSWAARAEERLKAEQALEAAATAEREKAKQALRQARKRLRKQCTNSRVAQADSEGLATEGVDFVCSVADVKRLEAIVSEMRDADEKGNENGALAVLLSHVKLLEEAAMAEARRRAQKNQAAEAERLRANAAKAAWADDELLRLGQALKRFPGGSLSRWEKVADAVGGKR